MAEKVEDPTRITKRKLIFNAVKAVVIATIIYVAYYFLWSLISPLGQAIPWLQQSIETFVMVYLALMIIGDLTSGTIYHYFFGTGKALFVIGYLLLTLKTGMLTANYENVRLFIDLRLFMIATMMLSLLSVAKSVLQTLDFMHQKAEFQAVL
jgi:hypothetical protein